MENRVIQHEPKNVKIRNFICYHKNFLTPSARQSKEEFVSLFAVGPDRYRLVINPDIIDGVDISEDETIAQENAYYCES